MTRWIRVIAIGLVLFSAACGKAEEEDVPYEISSSNLAGTVAGSPFEATSGFAKPGFDDGEIWVELHETEVEDPCGFQAFFDADRSVIFTSMGEPLDVELGFGSGQTITFAYKDGDDSQNDASTQGRLMIDEVSESRIKGGIYARMDEHEVDGQFDVVFCPE